MLYDDADLGSYKNGPFYRSASDSDLVLYPFLFDTEGRLPAYSVAYGYEFCGPRTLTIDGPTGTTWLSQGGAGVKDDRHTLTITGGDSSLIVPNPYVVTLTITLQDYPSVTDTMTFDVYFTLPCSDATLTASGTTGLVDNTYKVYAIELIQFLNILKTSGGQLDTLREDCGLYSIEWQQIYTDPTGSSGVSEALDSNLFTVDDVVNGDPSNGIKAETDDMSIIGSYALTYRLSLTDYPSISPTAFQPAFTLTVVDPCLTTTLQVPTITDDATGDPVTGDIVLAIGHSFTGNINMFDSVSEDNGT